MILPAATFIASATAILNVNAIPIFMDIAPRNYTIDPSAVESAITPALRLSCPLMWEGCLAIWMPLAR